MVTRGSAPCCSDTSTGSRSNGTLDDGAADSAHTCVSPCTTYLQTILRFTPMEKWAAAAGPAHVSPLGWAWDWARASPAVGADTADVVMLVAMGCHVQRVVARELKKAAVQRAAAATFGRKLVDDGLWAALGVVWERVQKTASPSPRSDHYASIAEDDGADLEALQRTARMLRETGEQYAQLLGETDVSPAHVQDVVNRLRMWTATIVTKAAPLAPPTVLDAIPGFATTG